MTLSQQTAQNREKLEAELGDHYGKFDEQAIDEITEETWKAAQEEVLERVDAELTSMYKNGQFDNCRFFTEDSSDCRADAIITELRTFLSTITNNQPPV